MKKWGIICNFILVLFISCPVVASDNISYMEESLENVTFEVPSEFEYETAKEDGNLYLFGQDNNCYFSVIAFDSSWIENDVEYVKSVIQSGIEDTFSEEYEQYEIIQDKNLSGDNKIAQIQIVSGRYNYSNAIDALYYVYENGQLISVRMLTYSSYESDVTKKNLDIMNHIITSLKSMGSEHIEEILEENIVQKEDTVIIDFTGKVDGQICDDLQGKDFELQIGSGMFIDGFEDSLIGVVIGETVDIPLTFPENYFNEKYAGKDIVFTVTVNGIKGVDGQNSYVITGVVEVISDTIFRVSTSNGNMYTFLPGDFDLNVRDTISFLYKGKIDPEKSVQEGIISDLKVIEKANYETEITYEDLARWPDDYKGKLVKLRGKVLQVLEEVGNNYIQIRLAVDGDYDQTVFGTYNKSIVMYRVLEDDWITIYGMSTGLTSYKSVLGGTITIPAVYIDRIDQE